jgi:hypothetical protein
MYSDQLVAIRVCAEKIADNYAGHEGNVLALIDSCQTAIEEYREGYAGDWEMRELDYARQAVANGFLRLALTAAEKALVVSQLPPAEYEYGMNYGHTSR